MRDSKTPLSTFAALCVAALLSACGDKPQTLDPAQVSAPAYQGTGTGYAAEGWKPGDETSWEEQMRRRAQGQNEHARVVAQ